MADQVGVGMRCEAVQVNIARPKEIESAAIRVAEPRFQTRIMMLASKSCTSDSANDVIAATATPPVALTAVGRRNAAWRSITSIATDNGTLVMRSVAKQRAVSPRRTPSGPMLTQSVRQP